MSTTIRVRCFLCGHERAVPRLSVDHQIEDCPSCSNQKGGIKRSGTCEAIPEDRPAKPAAPADPT